MLYGSSPIVELPVQYKFNCSINGQAETHGTWKEGEKEIITEAGSTSRLNICLNASQEIQGVKCVFALLEFSKALEIALPNVFGSKLGLLEAAYATCEGAGLE